VFKIHVIERDCPFPPNRVRIVADEPRAPAPLVDLGRFAEERKRDVQEQTPQTLEEARRLYLHFCEDGVDLEAELDLVTGALQELLGRQHGDRRAAH